MPERMPKPEKSAQETLKTELQAGTISPELFLKKITEHDQSDPKRSQSERNAALLSDPDIRALFESDESEATEYHHLRSLSEFHVGQRLIATDPASARTHFDAAFSAAEHIKDEDFKQWKLYILATLAYLDKNLDVLESIHPDLDEDRNKEIVGNMIKGLRETGEVDYARDYGRSKAS